MKSSLSAASCVYVNIYDTAASAVAAIEGNETNVLSKRLRVLALRITLKREMFKLCWHRSCIIYNKKKKFCVCVHSREHYVNNVLE